MTMRPDIISKILREWQDSEPALSLIMSTHEFVENRGITVPFRSGQGRVEYNPLVLETLPTSQIRSFLFVEACRIALGHPYQRRPVGCSSSCITMASNMVIADNYELPAITLPAPSDYGLESGRSFEYYAQKLMDDCSSEDEGGAEESSELWCQDEEWADQVSSTLLEFESSGQSWGSLDGTVATTIHANHNKKRLNVKSVLRWFRTGMRSKRIQMTRMRPSRRHGYEQMGRIHREEPNLLIAIDVSGSVDDDALEVFLSLTNRFFKYNLSQISIVTFDTQVSEIQRFTKSVSELPVVDGRGGTDFQPVFDLYNSSNSYTGLVIFTDGFAPVPSKSPKKVVWVFDRKESYDVNSVRLGSTGTCCVINN